MAQPGRSEGPRRDGEELFDDVPWWQARAIMAHELTGRDRMAAAADGAGYPGALERLVPWLPGHGGVTVDVGAGLGGASVWLATSTKAAVVALEPASGSAAGAALLWPQLTVVRARVDQVPLRSGFADAVTALGVLSLVDAGAPVIRELHRILRVRGRMAVADLVLTDGSGSRTSGPNTFRSLPRLAEELTARGFRVLDANAGDIRPDPRWEAASTLVAEEVERLHRGSPALRAWRADQARLGELLAAGDVAAGWLVAERIG
jgi:hypothetical protein